MTSEEQLAKWVDGESVHRGERPDGECTPDFSCCQPQLLAPAEERRAFVAADENGRLRFLGLFLGAAFASSGRRIHYAGTDPSEES